MVKNFVYPENQRIDFEDTMALPIFHINEIQIGSFLGTGGFCDVYAVQKIEVLDSYESDGFDASTANDSYHTSCEFSEETNFSNVEAETEGSIVVKRTATKFSVANHCRKETGNFRYAIKLLRPETENDAFDSIRHIATTDLLNEAYLLSSFNHPNIVKVYGVSSRSPSMQIFGSCWEINNSFFLMEKLEDTLERKIKSWKKSNKVFVKKFLGQKYMLWQRLKLMIDVSSAMEYLHERNIIYRDLKPENIGFDADGTVKLFDFGLARTYNENYKMTGFVGTLRYMAPEVLKSLQYNRTADVYSFGVLLWQVCALQMPYENHDGENHLKLIDEHNKRPERVKSIPSSLYTLMEQCWSRDIDKRPEFKLIMVRLQNEMANIKSHSNFSGFSRQKISKCTQKRRMKASVMA